MNVAGFIILAAMLTAYVVLDGYDLGVGAISFFITRDRRERGAAVAAIGPYWNGNEVWLIAAAGVLFALFPRAYASSFSGFYLPFMVLLWLLMFRGIAFELRGHLENDLWHDFWDTTFALASALLAVIFGVALGNLLQGLPLDAAGFFQGSFALLLNPYALGVGLLALLALSQHGLAFLALGGHGATNSVLGRLLWWAVLAADLALTAATFAVRPPADEHLWLAAAFGLVSFIALIAVRVCSWSGRPRATFAASCTFLATLVAAAAATIYPYLVPGRPGSGGISIFDPSPAGASMFPMLVITGVALVAVVSYTAFITYRFVRGTPLPEG
jgi:cytochrome d ubiquinol oxidase subunit II